MKPLVSFCQKNWSKCKRQFQTSLILQKKKICSDFQLKSFFFLKITFRKVFLIIHKICKIRIGPPSRSEKSENQDWSTDFFLFSSQIWHEFVTLTRKISQPFITLVSLFENSHLFALVRIFHGWGVTEEKVFYFI